MYAWCDAHHGFVAQVDIIDFNHTLANNEIPTIMNMALTFLRIYDDQWSSMTRSFIHAINKWILSLDNANNILRNMTNDVA